MALEKSSIKMLGVGFGLAIILVGLAMFGLETSGYINPAILAIVGGVLLIEVGIKRLTNVSNLKKLSFQQYFTVAIAAILLITAVLDIMSVSFAILSNISGFAVIVGALFFIVETLTN